MRKLSDAALAWRYGIRLKGLWMASNGKWLRDGSDPAVMHWPTIAQARDYRERHLPGQDAWAESIGIFQGDRDVTASLYGAKV